MMTSRPRGARMTIRDTKGRSRLLRAILIEDDPPATTWHYEVTVEPSRSKRFLRGADGEELERVLGRMANQLTPPRRAPRRSGEEDD